VARMYPQEQKSSDWCSNMVGINLLSTFPINIVLFVYAGFIYGITTVLSFCQLCHFSAPKQIRLQFRAIPRSVMCLKMKKTTEKIKKSNIHFSHFFALMVLDF
jgi:hypothetical protein